MDKSFEEEKCRRIIRQSPFEKQSNETFEWWLRLFHMMESEFLIPLHKRKEVVKAIFPDQIFKKIVSLMTLVEADEPQKSRSKITIGSTNKSTNGSDESSGTSASLVDSSSRGPGLKEEVKKEKGQDVHIRREVGAHNPYVRFFKRKPERAAIWRDLPPLSLDEMSLTQKAEAITEAIAVDFINWLHKLGGETPTTLDVPEVMKMFEVGFNTHAATSLQALVKEMPAVSKQVAESRGLKERTVQNTLYRKMKEDIKAYSREPRIFAFGTTLPSNMRIVTPKVDPTKRWTTARTNVRLKTMTTVWEGITDLRSTRAFCKWMIDHTELPAPTYLERLGMLVPEYFDQPHYSIDTQESNEEFVSTVAGPGDPVENEIK